jgi:tetratricopeptide (TPR) repeat protein
MARTKTLPHPRGSDRRSLEDRCTTITGQSPARERQQPPIISFQKGFGRTNTHVNKEKKVNTGKNPQTVLIIVALLSTMLVACGGGTPPPPTATPTPSASDHAAQGNAYYDQGQFEEAVAEFEEALQLDPDDAETHYNLGLAYKALGKVDEAIGEYQEAIRLDPDLAEAHNGLGNAYSDQGRLDAAIAEYEEAIRLDPDLSDAHFNLGHALMDQGEYEKALTAYQEAIRLEPDDPETRHNVGVAYAKMGLIDEAIAAWEEAIEVNPDFVETHYTLGLAYGSQDMFEQAAAQMEEVIRLDPERAAAHKHLGIAYYGLGKVEEAITALETYLQLQPDASDKAEVEAAIAELRQQAAGEPIEYHNAEGGYSLLYPGTLYHDDDHEWAVFAGSQAALQAAFDYAVSDAITEEAPVAMFDALPVSDLAEDLDLAESADPAEFVQAMAEDLEAEMSEVETFEIGRYPAAAADISGTYEGTPYGGALAIILVEERAIGATALAPPDQWDGFRPTFVNMVNSLAFFEPQK